MRRKKTQKEFIEELKEKNPTIQCIDTYKTIHEKIKFKCLTCKYEWFDSPSHVLNGRGCHRCNKKIRKTHEEFIDEANKKFNGDIKILSKYKGVDSPIDCMCLIHRNKWTTTPATLMFGNYGCKLCANKANGDRCRRTTEQFKEKLLQVTKGEYEICEPYINSKTAILFKHNKCKNTFKMQPDNFLCGQRCPHCVIPTKGEQRIIDFLKSHNEKYTFQKSYEDLRGINDGLLSYDIYLDNKNVLIEYQGQFHDGTAFKEDNYKFYRQQEHDKRKRQYAKEHNIKLLEIWYWDFDNIEKILKKELGLTA